MREKTTLFATVLVITSLALISCQIQPVKAETATITGTVLYNGEPVTDFTNKPANFWARDETSGQVFPITPSYDTSTGQYSIPNVPPGVYGISVYIDDAPPFNTGKGYAGDLDSWTSPITVSASDVIVNKDLNMERVLHLTSPVDNAAIIGYVPPPFDMYSEKIVFKWDALAEASSYHATIQEYEQPYTYLKQVTATSTSNTEWNVVLPISEENHFYLFELYAYNIKGLLVGELEVAYHNGYGWDYRFRVSYVAVCVDVKPCSCPNPINVGSKGVLPVAICGTEDFDVTTVDPTSVKLYVEGIAQGVPPIRWSYQDATGDGYLDIVFHFDTQTVVTKLGLAGHLGETIPLIIKGNLYPSAGGWPIQGQDYVWILKT